MVEHLEKYVSKCNGIILGMVWLGAFDTETETHISWCKYKLATAYKFGKTLYNIHRKCH